MMDGIQKFWLCLALILGAIVASAVWASSWRDVAMAKAGYEQQATPGRDGWLWVRVKGGGQ